MADTIESFTLTGEDWVNVNTITGIAVGSALTIQNQSCTPAYMAITTTKPDIDFVGEIVPANVEVIGYITAGENDVWMLGNGPVSVQVG